MVMTMKKRTERNQNIYDEINKEIQDIVRKNSNADFEDTHEILRKRNASLFGSDSSDGRNTSTNKNKGLSKEKLIPLLVIVGLIILIIVLAVVVKYGK